jgi:hypothetical protein
MKSIIDHKSNKEISRYSKAQSRQFAAICNVLQQEIDKILSKATSSIYYSMPVWFIDEKPVVGYNATAKYVNLLFWNGKAFKEPKLTAAGKYQAAQIKYTSIKEINLPSLRRWLKKAKHDIWDAKCIRA